MWEELGFYKGFALMWQAIYTKQERVDECAITTASPRYLIMTKIGPRHASRHIKRLLDLIEQFPTINPSASDSDLDIPKLFRQIRSRYKVLCSILGVKPSLRAAEMPPSRDQEEDSSLDVSIVKCGR
jgi:primary-amine oxidase